MIVVDDGSTDASRQVIADYGDRVRVVLKENGGQTSAFNTGFAACHGRIICFLDADDLLQPTALEAAAKLLRDPCVAKVHWLQWVIDQQGRRTGEVDPPRPLEGGDLRERAISEGPFAYTSAATSGNAYSRAFLDRVFPLPEEDHRHAPAGYLKALAPIYGAIAVLPEPQGYYRVHDANLYANSTSKEQIEFLLEHFEPRSNLLSHHLRTMGIEVEPAIWQESSRYRRWSAL